MDDSNLVIAILPTHTAAAAGIKEHQHSGFEMKKLSIIWRDYQTDKHVVGYYNFGNRMEVWGKTGAFWGGLWGLFFGSAFFWIPGLGPLLVAGPLVSWIIGALEGALGVGGLSAIGATVSSTRPAADYTARTIPRCEGVAIALEASHIRWQK